MEKKKGRKIKFCGILLCLLAAVVVMEIHAAKVREEELREILYENTEYGIGFWMPRGYTENPFQIFSTKTDGDGLMVAFFAPEADMQIFSLWYLNRAYWENEVKENFSGRYEEIYADEERVLLCVFVTDVQYDPADKEKKKEYSKLLGLKDEICDSFYTFAVPEQGQPVGELPQFDVVEGDSHITGAVVVHEGKGYALTKEEYLFLEDGGDAEEVVKERGE